MSKNRDRAFQVQAPSKTHQSFSRRDLVFGGGAVTALLAFSPKVLMGTAYAQTQQFDFYISPTGNDTNPGTQAQPWTIRALNTKRATYAGKRVGLLDGTYGLIDIFGQPNGGWTDNTILIAGGTSSARTVVQAVNRHGAIIDGQKSKLTSSSEQGLIGPGGSYVTIDGLRIINANYSATSAINVGSYLIVQNCWFVNQVFTHSNGQLGKNSATIFIQAHTGSILRNNRFEQGGAPADGNRHAFMLFYNSQDCIVEYNTVTSIGLGGNCVHFKATTDNKRMTVRYNYFDVAGSQIAGGVTCVLWHGNSGTDGYETCNNNVLVVGTAGIPFLNYGTSSTFRVYNNTLVGGGWTRDGGLGGLNAGSPRLEIYNNIFSRDNLGSQQDIRVGDLANVRRMDHNLYDGSPSMKVAANTGSWTSLASWQAATGNDMNSAQVSSALFVGSGDDAARYKLQPNSPGKTLGAGATEVGAWAGASQVGSSFGAGSIVMPRAPTDVVAL